MRLSLARPCGAAAVAALLAAAAALLAACGGGPEPPPTSPAAGGPPGADGSAGPGSKAGGKGSGVRRMARRLEEIARGLDPTKNIFINAERAALIRAGIGQNPSRRIELLPIRGTGLHRLPRGSRGAIREFLKALEARPDHLGARWLLNIAAMTLGEYPEGVPAGRSWRTSTATGCST